MELVNLTASVNDYRAAEGLAPLPMHVVESVSIDARRVVCEAQGDYFSKPYTIALVSGVGVVYNLSGSINVDLLWNHPGRAVHADGTEVSILPFGCSSRDLTYARSFQGYYWAVIESDTNTATITVWYADGSGAVPDGNLTIDFATIRSLANWPEILESQLVMKTFEMSRAVEVKAVA